jgi:iron complex outermembrane receptor protein
LLKARIAWRAAVGGYKMALWGKNLLANDRVSQPGGLTGTDIGTYHVGIIDPLTYRVDFRFIF